MAEYFQPLFEGAARKVVITVFTDAPPQQTQCSDVPNQGLGLAWHGANGVDQCLKELTLGSLIVRSRCLKFHMLAQSCNAKTQNCGEAKGSIWCV